jgi:DNA helicase-2/ATP-dependent DNA helicase PcrA
MAGQADPLKAKLAGLNPQQDAAVTAPERHVLVVAGPGSGKTQVITLRAAFLIANGVQPQAIVMLTFTNKAADGMPLAPWRPRSSSAGT